MMTLLLVVHILLALALTGVILVQRSEGGALGIGGGGGFMTARGQANLLTRTTAILAVHRARPDGGRRKVESAALDSRFGTADAACCAGRGAAAERSAVAVTTRTGKQIPSF
jgi:protein translocase SecG subunit